MSTQYLVIHLWPGGEASVMPCVETTAVSACIHRDHLIALDQGEPGHDYVVARCPHTG